MNARSHEDRQKWAPLLVGLVLLVPVASGFSPEPATAAFEEDGTTFDMTGRINIGFMHGIPDPLPEYLRAAGSVVMVVGPISLVVVKAFAGHEQDLLQQARSDPRVAYATIDGVLTASSDTNDPLSFLQWHLNAVNLPAAWKVTRGSHSVNLHVLDTGVDYSHADLLPNLSPVCDSPTSTGRGFTGLHTPEGYESSFHGTHVAGIAGAALNNTLGIAGASQSCLTSVRVLAGLSGAESWIAAGVTWSTDNGADIINLSLGGTGSFTALRNAIQYAVGQGVLVIAAAGNNGCPDPTSGDTVDAPGRFPEVVAVANLASTTTTSTGSSCGPAVEIAAPGSSILSTFPANGYARFDGTSMASPLVAGIAALAMDVDSTLTNQQVRCILSATASPLSLPANQVGSGRVDASGVVLAASDPASVGC